MKAFICAVFAGSIAVAIAPAAIADPQHCPPGHEKQGKCDFGPKYEDRTQSDIFFQDDRDSAERAYRAGYEDGLREGYRAGQRLPRDAQYTIIRDYDRYGLNAPQNGYYYAQVDDEVLLVEAATRVIAQALGAY